MENYERRDAWGLWDFVFRGGDGDTSEYCKRKRNRKKKKKKVIFRPSHELIPFDEWHMPVAKWRDWLCLEREKTTQISPSNTGSWGKLVPLFSSFCLEIRHQTWARVRVYPRHILPGYHPAIFGPMGYPPSKIWLVPEDNHIILLMLE
jgi:hypothetical protein